MSHNKIKVAGQEPNASGDITLSLDNLSDVNTAGVQANQTLIYNGSSYVAGNKEGVLGVVFLTSNNTSSNYPQTLNATNNVYWYAPTPINTIIGASLLDSDSLGSNWYDGVTLPAGDYIIQCSLHGDFTGSTGQCKFVLKAGLTEIGCIAESADPSNNSEYPNDASAYFSSGSSFDLTADMLTLTAANSTTTDLQAKRGYLYIWKVS